VVREAVLNAAMELIAAQGYEATSMSQVAATAGISPSGLAHHFPTREDLLAAVLERRDELDNCPLEITTDNPWDFFDHMVVLARRNAENRRLVLLYVSLTGEATNPDHPGHPWMVGHFDHVLGNLRDALTRGVRNGRLRADTPVELVCRGFVGLMDGIQLQWLLDAEVDMAELLDTHLTALKKTWSIDGA
jgi:AcrR family transcriptional regulator